MFLPDPLSPLLFFLLTQNLLLMDTFHQLALLIRCIEDRRVQPEVHQQGGTVELGQQILKLSYM